MVILPLNACLTGPVAKIAYGYGIEKFAYLRAQVQPHFTGNTIFFSGTLLTRCVANTKHQLKGSLGGTDDVTKSNFFGVFDKVVTSVRAPLAAKDLSFFQLLEDLLQIPGADLLTSGDVFNLGGKTY
jgi:hypothetical protein